MKIALVVAALLATSVTANAAPITTLFNTGVGYTGSLPFQAFDTHYTLVSAPGAFTATPRVGDSSNGFPIPPWVGDDAASKWIGINSDTQFNGPIGNYDYRTTFSLAGFNPATAAIIGQWSVDNTGVDILINGHSTGQTNSNQFQTFTSFAINSGFVAGVNTIDFIVNNAGGPTGLRVEQTGSATASPVPEAGSFALFGLGMAALGLGRRRRG